MQMEASFKNQNLKGVFIMPVKNVIKKNERYDREN
jgi:hypothetical protein|nr:MAG TPA: hypothetical protein [Caudoviricetes sp.]